jgi:hypothetical protein
MPVRHYISQILQPSPTQPPPVGHPGMALIVGTALLTVLVNLSVAVIVCTIIFYLARKFFAIEDINTDGAMHDEN